MLVMISFDLSHSFLHSWLFNPRKNKYLRSVLNFVLFCSSNGSRSGSQCAGLQGPQGPLGWRPCSGASAPCLAWPSQALLQQRYYVQTNRLVSLLAFFAVTVVGGRTEIGRGCAVALHMLKVQFLTAPILGIAQWFFFRSCGIYLSYLGSPFCFSANSNSKHLKDHFSLWIQPLLTELKAFMERSWRNL